MGILGNILWFICGGLFSGLSWVLAGCLWCISIIGIPMAVGNAVAGLICCITITGIPFGEQFFKIAKLSLMPFGAEVAWMVRFTEQRDRNF